MKVLKSIWFSSAHRGAAKGPSASTSEHAARLEAFYAGQAALCEL
jgi:hypothetical protein